MDELTRMGADIKVESNVAIINGVDHYMGARVSAPDLRAGAALVIAGLAAEGITVIDDIHFIESRLRRISWKNSVRLVRRLKRYQRKKRSRNLH